MFLRSLFFKKYLEIAFIISLITLCCVFLTNFVLISLKTVAHNNERHHKTVDQLQNEFTHPIEPPLKHKLKSILKCRDRHLQAETLQHGQYWLLKNYIRGRLSTNMECGESITYAANGDYTFIKNLPTVVGR